MELVKDKSGAKKRKEKKKAKKAAYVLKSKLKKTKANAAKEISKKKKRGNATADKSSEVLPVVNDFRVLRVAVDAKRNTVRHWFLKKHESENEKSTVVVAGIPPYVSKDCLERIFCEFGDVKDVVFQRAVDDSLFESSTEKGFQTALVRFATSERVSSIMDDCHKAPLKFLFTKETPVVSGWSKWCSQYKTKYLDSKQLKQAIDTYMTEFDEVEKERKEEEKKRRNQPDDDGWVTVTRSSRGRVPPAVLATKAEQLQQPKKKRKIDESLNAFYSFQVRESKMKNLQNLRQKFEEDKKRLALTKAARKFRPL